jgi:type I restriction enzyme S subunit
MWKKKKLADVCEVFTDGDWIETKDQSTAEIRLIQTGNVGIGNFKYRSEKARFISLETFGKLKCKEIFEGDCIISRLPDPVGRSCIIPDTGECMITAVDCTIVRLKKDNLLPDFFNYYTRSKDYLSEVEKRCSGATRKRISRKNLGNIEIPLPPLPEQKRIVAILDEAFEGIDAAIANTQANLAAARELFESYLNRVFTEKGEGWVEKKLEKIGGSVSTGPFGSLLHKSDYVIGGIPLINPANINGTEIIPDERKAVSEDTMQRLLPYKLKAGDIVVGRRGEIGRCAVVTPEQDGWLCGTGSFIIHPHASVNPSFLAHLIRSKHYKKKLEDLSTGATMKNLSNSTLSNMLISLPSTTEQNRILDKLQDIYNAASNAETLYQQKLDALHELKQSILTKAFRGELTQNEVAA